MKKHLVYLITSPDNDIYVGCTSNFESRKKSHICHIKNPKGMELYLSLSQFDIDDIEIFPITHGMSKFDALYTEGSVLNMFFELDGYNVLNKHLKLEYSHIGEGIVDIELPTIAKFYQSMSRMFSSNSIYNELKEAGK